MIPRHTPGALVLALLGGCGPRIPPDPLIGVEWSWRVDRDALPGGTLRALEVATVGMKPRLAVAGTRGAELRAPVWVLVLDHPDEGLVLVDAGYGRRTATDPHDYPGRAATRLLDLQMARPIADALPDLGLSPADVQHVVLSHAHTDHVGGVEDLPDATLWVASDEWGAADEKRPFKGYDPTPYADRDPREVTFADTPPYGPFPHHVDLFDDGSVVLLPAPGHTAGHIMVLINLPEGSVLYSGDAAWVDANWMGPTPKGALPRSVVEHDWREGIDALWRLKHWADRYPELTVIAGHEPSDIDRLPPWPEPLLP